MCYINFVSITPDTDIPAGRPNGCEVIKIATTRTHLVAMINAMCKVLGHYPASPISDSAKEG